MEDPLDVQDVGCADMYVAGLELLCYPRIKQPLTNMVRTFRCVVDLEHIQAGACDCCGGVLADRMPNHACVCTYSIQM